VTAEPRASGDSRLFITIGPRQPT